MDPKNSKQQSETEAKQRNEEADKRREEEYIRHMIDFKRKKGSMTEEERAAGVAKLEKLLDELIEKNSHDDAYLQEAWWERIRKKE